MTSWKKEKFRKTKGNGKRYFQVSRYLSAGQKEIEIEKDIQRKDDDFDRLMLLIKEKLNDNSLKTSQKL